MSAGVPVRGIHFYNQHVPKNVLLIFFSLATLPVSIALACLGFLHSRIYRGSRTIVDGHQPCKRILVTGISTTSGLTIARLLNRYSRHRIFGADVEIIPLTSPGRYSRSVAKFFRLDAPEGDNAEPSVDSLLSIIRKEKIDLWINCSTIVTAVEDAEIKRLAGQIRGPGFKSVQFSEDAVRRFHEKDQFIGYIRSLGLQTLESHRCTDEEEVMQVLLGDTKGEVGRRRSMELANSNGDRRKYIDFLGLATPESWRDGDEEEGFFDVAEPVTPPRSVRQSFESQKMPEQILSQTVAKYTRIGAVVENRNKDRKFVMKQVGEGARDKALGVTLLPFSDAEETKRYIKKLKISKEDPYHLQQYISGPEYRTHTLIIHGRVISFVAYRSTSIPIHYTALPPISPLSKYMLEFTETVAREGGHGFTGHLGIIFQAESESEDAEIYPVSCNLGAHTSIILHQQTEQLAHAYLPLLNDSQFEIPSTIIRSQTPSPSYYWIGHDLVTLLCIPILSNFVGYGNVKKEIVEESILELWEHLRYWKDGTFVDWDPLPFLVLYHVYWPLQFLRALMKGRRWTAIDVSTMQMAEE